MLPFSSFVIIDWRVLLSAFYISLWYSIINFIYLYIKDGLLHKITCVWLIIFYNITSICCFFIFNFLTFIDKVSVYFFTKLLMLRILFSTSCIYIVLNNITKFYKILWNCFQRVYITFQRFLASTFSKYRCINTSCSLDLGFSCIIVTSSSTFTFVQADLYIF